MISYSNLIEGHFLICLSDKPNFEILIIMEVRTFNYSLEGVRAHLRKLLFPFNRTFDKSFAMSAVYQISYVDFFENLILLEEWAFECFLATFGTEVFVSPKQIGSFIRRARIS